MVFLVQKSLRNLGLSVKISSEHSECGSERRLEHLGALECLDECEMSERRPLKTFYMVGKIKESCPAQNFMEKPQPHDLSLTVDREDSAPPRAINETLQLPKRLRKRKVSRKDAPRGLVDESTGLHSGEGVKIPSLSSDE